MWSAGTVDGSAGKNDTSYGGQFLEKTSMEVVRENGGTLCNKRWENSRSYIGTVWVLCLRVEIFESISFY